MGHRASNAGDSPDLKGIPPLEDGARGPSRRGPALRFACVFIAAILTFLLVFRYGSDTLPMDAYLFRVATDTSALLGLVGEACRVENPGQFRGREAEIRQALCDWQGRAPRRAAAKEADSRPLSAWEAWRYRALRLRRDAEAYHEARERLERPPPEAEINSPAEHVEYVRTRLTILAAFLPGPGGESPACEAAPGLADYVHEAQRVLDEMGGAASSPDMDVEAFGQRLLQIQGELEGWRERQRAFLAERAEKLEARLREFGPRVDFVLRSGSEAGGGASDGGVTEHRFRFDVVPDCGALPSIAVFVSAVLAFPAPWRRKLIGVAGGLPILYAINLFRLGCLAVIGVIDHEGRWFTFAHEYVWQGVYIICEVTLWLVWLELVVRSAPRRAPGKGETS